VLVEQNFCYGDTAVTVDNAGFQLRSRVNLVDLAGSERGRTRKWNTMSDCIEMQEKEAIKINKSLLVLNPVISNLSDNKSYAPLWRVKAYSPFEEFARWKRFYSLGCESQPIYKGLWRDTHFSRVCKAGQKDS